METFALFIFLIVIGIVDIIQLQAAKLYTIFVRTIIE